MTATPAPETHECPPHVWAGDPNLDAGCACGDDHDAPCHVEPTQAPALSSPDGRYRVWFKDSRHMDEVKPKSVQLVFTSPPYGLGVAYGNTPGQVEVRISSWADFDRYLNGVKEVLTETYSKCDDGAYLAINVAPTHTHAKANENAEGFDEDASMLPTTERLVSFLVDELKATFRWKYVWVARRTRNNAGGSPTSFLGSFGKDSDGNRRGLSLRGQVLRMTEEIVVAQKGPLVISEEREARRRDPRSWLTRDQWRDTFSQVWGTDGDSLPGETTSDHPAVFPVELARRIVRGYSVIGDTVLDPFVGRGTTLIAARELDRNGLGYELETAYEGALRASGVFLSAIDTQWG